MTTTAGVDLRVEPLTATIGAEIHGVNIAEHLPDETIAAIYAALLEWKVIFFRDQHDLDQASHMAFGRRFGELEIHPTTRLDAEHREVMVLPSGGTQKAPSEWHSDVTWRPEPSLGSILRAIEVPAVGGDTLWADMAAAYDLLDEETKERIAHLQGLNDFTAAFGRGRAPEEQEHMRSVYPTVEHPVVRTHPDTGRKTLYVNTSFTIGIKGMADDEARPLLQKLFAMATIPDVQCRFRWRAGSVAFWDNRATQHIASNDHLPARRLMERVTIVGDRPY